MTRTNGAGLVLWLAGVAGCTAPIADPFPEAPVRPFDLPAGEAPSASELPADLAAAVAPVLAGHETWPIDLEGVLRLAGADAAEVERARARLAVARGAASATGWRFLPSLALGGDARYESGRIVSSTGDTLDTRFSFLTVGALLRYALNPGQAIYDRIAAGKRVEEGVARTEAERLAAELDAATLYCDLEEAHSRAAIASAVLGNALARAELVERQAASGLIAPAEREDLAVEVARRRREHVEASRDAHQASVALAHRLRLDPRVTFSPPRVVLLPLALVDPDVTVESLLERAAAARPELLAQDHAFAAADADVHAAGWTAFGPGVALSAFGGQAGRTSGSATALGPDGFGRRTSLSAGVWETLSGESYAAFQITRRLRDVSRLESVLLGEQVRAAVVAAVSAARDARSLVERTQAEVAAAGRAEAAARDRRRQGLESGIDSLYRAELTADARVRAARAIGDWNRAQLRLLWAIGAIGPAR